MKVKGHKINEGYAEGEAIVSCSAFSFAGDLDPESGLFTVPEHALEGQKLAGKVFVFTTGHGSSFGPFYAYRAKKAGNAPAAMICIQAEPILALAVITADIPMVDKLEKNPLDVIETGDYVKVDATKGIVEVIKGQR
jgi:predicted aconitase with swiveling domain